MEERRNHAGGALLGSAALCWVSTIIADGTKTLDWASTPSILLFAAGMACFLASLWAFDVFMFVPGVRGPETNVSRPRPVDDGIRISIKGRLVQEWDTQVLEVLADETRERWLAAATLPKHRLDPASTIGGVRMFLATKLVCLKEIISELDADQRETR